MGVLRAEAIVGSQLRSLKKMDGFRFIYGQWEVRLKAGGSWFAPMFYVGMRNKNSYRGRFTEIGSVDAHSMYNGEKVVNGAVEVLKKKGVVG